MLYTRYRKGSNIQLIAYFEVHQSQVRIQPYHNILAGGSGVVGAATSGKNALLAQQTCKSPCTIPLGCGHYKEVRQTRKPGNNGANNLEGRNNNDFKAYR